MEPWRTVVFATIAKGRDDTLLDCLTLIPSYLYELDNMRSKQTTYTTADAENLYQKALSLKRSLEDWLVLYQHKDDKDSGINRYLPLDSSGSHRIMYYLWMHQDDISKDEIYHWTTGMMLTLSVLRDVCAPPSSPREYDNQIVQQAGFVLSIMPHIDRKWGTKNGPLALVLPLKTIAIVSPDSGQREYARKRLANWDKGIGCGGYFRVPVLATGNLYEMDSVLKH